MNTNTNTLTSVNNRYQPSEVFGELDHFVNNLFGGSRSANVREPKYLPPVDVSETQSAYKVRVELAGVSRDDLDVTIDEGVLTISAERKDQHDEEVDGKVIRRERRYGKFQRSLKLAEEIVEEEVAARYDNGVLVLEVPKAEQKQPRKVDVLVS